MLLHSDIGIVLLKSKKLLPIMVVSIGAIVIIAAVIILFVVPLQSSFINITANKNLVTVYPQILYPTQLRVGQEGSFSPSIYELDSNNKAQQNIPFLFEWNFGDGTNPLLQKINSTINNDQYGLYPSSIEVKHAYAHEGTYQVTLKATDGKGYTGTHSAQIKVIR